MNLSGPALPSRLVIEKPYFLAIVAEVDTPSLEANPSSPLMLVGPGTPTRTGSSTPRRRTSASQSSTRSTSNSTWVTTAPGICSLDSAADLLSSADQSTWVGTSGWSAGWPAIETWLTP